MWKEHLNSVAILSTLYIVQYFNLLKIDSILYVCSVFLCVKILIISN